MITKKDIIAKAHELQHSSKKEGVDTIAKDLGFESEDLVAACRELSVGSGFEFGTEEFINTATAYLVGIQIGAALAQEEKEVNHGSGNS